MQQVVFFAPGTPAPQGSKAAIPVKDKATGIATGKINVVESSKALAPWRSDVRDAAMAAMLSGRCPMFTGPVEVGLTFRIARPKGHYGTGRNAGILKDSAPMYPAVKPDLDKLVRSTLDALTSAGVYADDNLVVGLGYTTKRYALAGEPTGVEVRVRPMQRTIGEALAAAA